MDRLTDIVDIVDYGKLLAAVSGAGWLAGLRLGELRRGHPMTCRDGRILQTGRSSRCRNDEWEHAKLEWPGQAWCRYFLQLPIRGTAGNQVVIDKVLFYNPLSFDFDPGNRS